MVTGSIEVPPCLEVAVRANSAQKCLETHQHGAYLALRDVPFLPYAETIASVMA